MRNCLILGSGRSGTSMLAGTLGKAGYFMGDKLYPANYNNPKGFFEDPEINGINERLLEGVNLKTIPFAKYGFSEDHLKENEVLKNGQRWLLRIPLGIEIPSNHEIDARIEAAVARAPFCYKDPRYSYTLPAWRPFLKDIVFLCVFRDPAATAASIVKACGVTPFLSNVTINFDIAMEVWLLLYQRIMEVHRREGEWLFVHYNDILNGKAFDKIEAFTGACVDRSFPDEVLKRSQSDYPVPDAVKNMYVKLCELADYDDASVK